MGIIDFIYPAIQIMIINLFLSADNLSVIALSIRNLPPEQARKANIIGISVTITISIFFASILTIIMSLSWLPIKLIGGLLLLLITYRFIKEETLGDTEVQSDENGQNYGNDNTEYIENIKNIDNSNHIDNNKHIEKHTSDLDCKNTELMIQNSVESNLSNGIVTGLQLKSLLKKQTYSEELFTQKAAFYKAVLSIIIADISMSLDNILATGSIAKGNIGLVAVGLLLDIPVLFFGSQLVTRLMRNFNIIIYFGASALIFTSITMIMEDTVLKTFITFPILFKQIVPWLSAISVLLFGIANIIKVKVKSKKQKYDSIAKSQLQKRCLK